MCIGPAGGPGTRDKCYQHAMLTFEALMCHRCTAVSRDCRIADLEHSGLCFILLGSKEKRAVWDVHRV